MDTTRHRHPSRGQRLIVWALCALASAVVTFIVKEILTISDLLGPLTRRAGGWVAGHPELVLWFSALLISLALTGAVLWIIVKGFRQDAAGPPALEQALEQHRIAIAQRVGAKDWWEAPLPLRVRTAAGVQDGRERVAKWAQDVQAGHCAIIGDPGAGKTGLVWWAAAVISRIPQAVPVVVHARKLKGRRGVDLAGLLEAATPPLPAFLASLLIGRRKLYLLLDGLDELVGIGAKGHEIASELLGSVISRLPAGAKVLVSSRTAPFTKLKPRLDESVPDAIVTDGDDYDDAFAKSFGLTRRMEVLELLPVESDAAAAFLARSHADSAFVDVVAEDEAWANFLSSPLLIRFADFALPHLARAGVPELDLFYDHFVRSVLHRNNPGLDANGIRETMRGLRELSNVFRPRRSATKLDAAVRAGLLRDDGGTLSFHHYSLWEFFFAGFLHEELERYSAETLAHVDLVNGYNVNRFLLPMVRRGMPAPSERPLPATPVSPANYLHFLEHSGWRRDTGYGLHPSMTASRDGVVSATFDYDGGEATARHFERSHGGDGPVACQLSWYDAAMFARFHAVRLPSWKELAQTAPGGPYLFWTADWQDEKKAHVRVYNARDGSEAGLNPDVRLPRTALAVVPGGRGNAE